MKSHEALQTQCSKMAHHSRYIKLQNSATLKWNITKIKVEDATMLTLQLSLLQRLLLTDLAKTQLDFIKKSIKEVFP